MKLCIECKHCIKNCSWWVGWQCRANPYPTAINPVNGVGMHYCEEDGLRTFGMPEFRECDAINLDGNCPTWEKGEEGEEPCAS
jgi:hypothetical protein